jgi:hypothetical protein
LEGTSALVCHECGSEYAPELVEMLRKLRRAQYERYVAELRGVSE